MVLLFSVQKHVDIESLSKLVLEMMTQVQKPETAASLKAYLFIILEFLFSQRNFDMQTLKKMISIMFNCEEILSEHLSNQVYVVSFLRAFLQLVLNFYSQHPMEAKPYIPAFLGVVLELFTDKDLPLKDSCQSQEIGLDSLNNPDQVPSTLNIKEKNNFVSKNNYSGLAEQLFEMLVEHSFDSFLFSDLGSNDSDELTDLFANIDFRKDVSHGSGRVMASTSSKIFALMNYGLSERFTGSRSFICKILLIMIKKIGSLKISFSESFHINLAKMAEVLLNMGKSLKEADLLLGQIFELVDLNIAFEIFSKESGLDINQPSVFEKEEFSHIMFIFSRHCKSLDFEFFLNRIFPLLQHILQKDTTQMTQIEEILMKKIFSSVSGFKNFKSLWSSNNQHLMNNACQCLLSSLLPFSEKVSDLQTSFLGIFQSFLMSLFQIKDEYPFLIQIVVQNFRTINILGKFCSKVAESDRNMLEENCLQLIVRLLPRDYINQVFEKNCERIIHSLTQKEKIQKGLKEGVILGFICRAYGAISRDEKILFKMFFFIQEILNFKSGLSESNSTEIRKVDKKKFILKANCLVLQLLTFLTPNVPSSLYSRILDFACQTTQQNQVSKANLKKNSSLQIEGQSGSKQKKEVNINKFDQHALRFCLQLFLSMQLNMTKANELMVKKSKISIIKSEMLATIAEYFLPIVLVNVKSRNNKTRKYAKEVLKKMVEFEHFGGIKGGKVRVNSLSVSAVIAGLVGTSSYIKSCAIQSLGYMLKGFYPMFEDELKQSLLELVLMLVRERNKEIFLSVLKFLKTFVKLEPAENIKKNKIAIKETIFH